MKCLAFVLVIVLLLAACGGAQTYDALEPIKPARIIAQPHHYGEFDSVRYSLANTVFTAQTLEGLQDEFWAPNVVRGRMANDPRIVFERSDRRGGGVNIVSFNILEVIQGDLSIGETITVIEPYYLVGRSLHTHSSYLPSTANQEYILFIEGQRTILTISTHREYITGFFISHGERGRFPILSGSAAEQDFSDPVFGLSSGADVEVYARLWEEVMNAFVN